MPVDFLKINGSFVRDMVTDPVSEAMVASINQVGHIMNLKTIAEYVHDKTTHERVIVLGVDYSQGYALGKPRPLIEALKELTGV